MSDQAIITREIEYQDHKGQKLVGYFAYPANQTALPAILVCPEWWGRNDYIERRARELAERGYAAFAVDMYGDKKLALDADTAYSYMMATFDDASTIVDRATAALNTLSTQVEVDNNKVAVIGFCYGGKVALDLARSGAKLQAVATFHANLSTQTPAQTENFTAEVLVAHGQDDSMTTLQDVETFEQEMNAAKVNYRVNIYPNTKHGFTNPAADENARKYGVDLGYNPLAEAQSLDAMYALLARTLK